MTCAEAHNVFADFWFAVRIKKLKVSLFSFLPPLQKTFKQRPILLVFHVVQMTS